jgi:hypothetical protein
MTTITTASLTTTGATPATGIAMLVHKQQDNVACFQVSGTYGSVNFVTEGTCDASPSSSGNWFPVAAVPQDLASATSGTIAPADNSTHGYKVDCTGHTATRLRITAIGSGTVVATYNAFAMVGGAGVQQTLQQVGSANPLFTGPITNSVGGSTAATGSTYADAAALPAGTAFLYPVTASDGTKGVIINAADQVTGRTIMIGGVAGAVTKIYAPSGGTINGGSANAAFSTASGHGALLTCISGSGNTWAAV